jgi:hypothetical protein
MPSETKRQCDKNQGMESSGKKKQGQLVEQVILPYQDRSKIKEIHIAAIYLRAWRFMS